MISMKTFRLPRVLRLVCRTYSQIISNTEPNSNITTFEQRNQEIPIQPIAWQSMVSEVEKVIGYSTTYLNPRWLLDKEESNIALHMQRLHASEHPFLPTVKSVLSGNLIQPWGLVVLLVSKAANTDQYDKAAENQKLLAGIVEMIRVGIILQRTISKTTTSERDQDRFEYGNKLALLCGDYLLSRSFLDSAMLRNHIAHGIISSSLRDLSEMEFFGIRDFQNNLLPSEPKITRIHIRSIIAEDNDDSGPYDVSKFLGNPIEEWALYNVLSGVNLLAKFCQCALILSRQSTEQQKAAFLFGKHFALAWHLRKDLEEFENSTTFSLLCAPVMMHLKHDPKLYREIKKGRHDVSKCDYESIRRIVKSGLALESIRKLRTEMRSRALKSLSSFDNSETKDLLEKIVLYL